MKIEDLLWVETRNWANGNFGSKADTTGQRDGDPYVEFSSNGLERNLLQAA